MPFLCPHIIHGVRAPTEGHHEPHDVFYAKCECGWRMNLTYNQYEDERIFAALALQHDEDTK